jgi:hypothetical protein
VDVDKCEDSAAYFNIESLPTLKSIYLNEATKSEFRTEFFQKFNQSSGFKVIDSAFPSVKNLNAQIASLVFTATAVIDAVAKNSGLQGSISLKL